MCGNQRGDSCDSVVIIMPLSTHPCQVGYTGSWAAEILRPRGDFVVLPASAWLSLLLESYRAERVCPGLHISEALEASLRSLLLLPLRDRLVSRPPP